MSFFVGSKCHLFLSLLSHFGGNPQKSLLSHFNFSGFGGFLVEGFQDHNSTLQMGCPKEFLQLYASLPMFITYEKRRSLVIINWGKLFYLQLELFCLQLSFCAYSPSRPFLDALFIVSEKAPIVSKKAKVVSKKRSNCK